MKFLPPDMTFAVDWALKTIIYLSTPPPHSAQPSQYLSMAHVSEKVVLVLVLVLILCYR